FTAQSGIGTVASSLDTAANLIDASVTAAGAVVLNELNAVTLDNLTTANVLVTVTSGNAMTINTVQSTTDAQANAITLLATTGNITVGSVKTGTLAAAGSGDVNVTSQSSSIPAAVNYSLSLHDALPISFTAQSGIGTVASSLDTAANQIDASVTAA